MEKQVSMFVDSEEESRGYVPREIEAQELWSTCAETHGSLTFFVYTFDGFGDE
jgi:hypothetical protein